VSIGVRRVAHPLTIVIVEDDGEMRDVLRIFLEREGFRTIEFESATRAHDELEFQAFDAVILDKEMPGIDGLDFLAYLHGRFPHVPVILMTAFGGAGVADAAFARGAARYIEKPFPMKGVVSAVRSAIDAARGT
jgi:two-component system nitrogen regulation response regulator GlnG